MTYVAGDPITGFTLTLDGESEAIEKIARAAMREMQKQVEKKTSEQFDHVLELHPSRFGFALPPVWPVKGKIQLRTDA